MRTMLIALLMMLTLSSTVLSGPYDGLYFIGNSSCDPNMVGIDGGEGEEWERRYLIMESEVGIYWIVGGYVMELIRCS